ncbi:NAD(P)/FAD-dependent oxidoreductase [Pseudoflavonifractor phocaeensis]|uniref:NAD(P)/FAD-dependent oxidoreductase n=1 Tax=Pseudoflavonifractor phocaeensis TaxID=1870988 RepID=UPI0019573F6A|nr:NAD(P)/FAD-dependent oxidoreductase [Pseudoflavonifractor phocaeensis]MBM6924397.1 NAD(P)/FAD-dependent oxidoreductase [Pseudoflavonifractor phocaeensis]
MYDVFIIGCGITGAAAAFHLSRYQLKIAIAERENDVAAGTTKANSAILHAGYDPRPGTLMAKLNLRGAQLARELCAGLDVPYRPCGSLVLAFSPEDQATLRALYDRGRANGVPELALLSGAEARAIEPNLSPQVTAALWAPTAAICSPWEYCLALAETAVANGAELRLETAVTGLEPLPGGWLIHTDRGDLTSRYVLNVAGVSAQAVHQMAAPKTFTIHPSQGQYYLLDKSEGNRVGRVIFQCPGPAGKGVLVAPTVHGNLIAGPNAVPVAGEDLSTTADGLAFVRDTALKSVPSIRFSQSIRNFAGVRAAADTGDFVIGWAAPRFLDLAGICSPGLTAAPAIAEYAAGLLEADGLSLTEKPDFLCRRTRLRFHTLSPAEKAELVAREPAYGRVICRCETVTEGDILAALRGPIPPRSVDGVKRRVGAGMGRCQGGFCGPRVVELLARELDLSPGQIVQERAGSWLLARETKGGASHV